MGEVVYSGIMRTYSWLVYVLVIAISFSAVDSKSKQNPFKSTEFKKCFRSEKNNKCDYGKILSMIVGGMAEAKATGGCKTIMKQLKEMTKEKSYEIAAPQWRQAVDAVLGGKVPHSCKSSSSIVTAFSSGSAFLMIVFTLNF